VHSQVTRIHTHRYFGCQMSHPDLWRFFPTDHPEPQVRNPQVHEYLWVFTSDGSPQVLTGIPTGLSYHAHELPSELFDAHEQRRTCWPSILHIGQGSPIPPWVRQLFPLFISHTNTHFGSFPGSHQNNINTHHWHFWGGSDSLRPISCFKKWKNS